MFIALFNTRGLVWSSYPDGVNCLPYVGKYGSVRSSHVMGHYWKKAEQGTIIHSLLQQADNVSCFI